MNLKTNDLLALWVDHQLGVLSEYGFNHYDVCFFSDSDIKNDCNLTKNSFESYESGLLGLDDDLLWRQNFKNWKKMSYLEP